MKIAARNKGFTLVEIMIVVVIIGLLAAMAIPAFQKVRQNAVTTSAVNDARQLATAAQQYILENAGILTLTVGATTSNGTVTGVLSGYVKKISKGTSVGNYDGSVTGATPAFTLSNAQITPSTLSFDTEGKRL